MSRDRPPFAGPGTGEQRWEIVLAGTVTHPTRSRRTRTAADLLAGTRFRRDCSRFGNERHSITTIPLLIVFFFAQRHFVSGIATQPREK